MELKFIDHSVTLQLVFVFAWPEQYVAFFKFPLLILYKLYFRKASKLFEKNAAPLLHLAGLEVNLVKVSFIFLLLLFFILLKNVGESHQSITLLERKENA